MEEITLTVSTSPADAGRECQPSRQPCPLTTSELDVPAPRPREEGTRAVSDPPPAGRPPRRSRAPSDDERAAFDRWWGLVPRKVARQQALATWIKLSRGLGGPTGDLSLPPWPVLERATQRWAEDASRQEARYVKHPSTWLSAGCWEDSADVDTGASRAASKAAYEQRQAELRRQAEERLDAQIAEACRSQRINGRVTGGDPPWD